MADMQADRRDFAADEGIPISRLVNGACAVLSLGLAIGIGVWGYGIVMRDAGGVPVIKAASGDMRVRPPAPGGEPAAHQGLAVNSIAAVGVAQAVPDQVMLAPRPVALTDDDKPMGRLPARVFAAAAPPEAEAGVTEDTAAATDATQGEGEATGQPTGIEALAAAMAKGAAPLAKVEAAPDLTGGADLPAGPALMIAARLAASPAPATAGSAEDAATPEPETQLVAAEGTLSRSLRPRVRPAMIHMPTAAAAAVVPAAATVTEASAAPSALDVDPDSVPPGSRLAQIGALESEEAARTEWERLSSRFAEFMDGKQRVIQKAQSGGRAFYRLRAMGFADLSEARSFCAAFVAENAECIPVVAK